MTKTAIPDIRAFNRWYTDIIGLLERHLLDSSYNLSEARLMFELNQAGHIQASQIRETLHIDKSYLSRILRKLEKDMIVKRSPSPADGRAILLSLTEKGKRAFAGLNRASDQQISSLVDHLDEGGRMSLSGHMEEIRRLLTPGAGARPEVTIRTNLTPGDLGYIAYMHGQVYDREHQYGLGFESYVLEGLGEFGATYDPAKDRVWVCEDGSEMVGFLVAVHRGKAIQLRYFILLPGYRGLGLGKRLMDLFMEFVRERGYRHAYLWTTNEQQAAIALYMRYGFRLTEQKESKSFDKALTELKYELTL